METFFGSRLREERERLGFNQIAFAEICGQKKHSQIRYESGERSPDGDYLFAASSAGADVLYIVTGRREANAPERIDTHRLALAIEAVEEGLMQAKRTLPPDKKAELIKATYDLISQPDADKSKVVELLRIVA